MTIERHRLVHLIGQRDEELEALLASTLIPLRPRQDFIEALRDQLGKVPIPIRPTQQLPNIPIWLVGVGALISASMVLNAGLRTAIAVLGAFGILQHISQKPNKKPRAIRIRPSG